MSMLSIVPGFYVTEDVSNNRDFPSLKVDKLCSFDRQVTKNLASIFPNSRCEQLSHQFCRILSYTLEEVHAFLTDFKIVL